MVRQIPALGLAALILLGSAPPPGAAGTPLPRPADAAAEPAPPAAPVSAPAPAPATEPDTARDLFAMPRIIQASRAALELAQAGDLAAAAAAIDPLIAAHPGVGLLQADSALLAMLAGDTEAARAGMLRAGQAGFPELAAWLGDPLFAPLAGDPELAALAAATVTASVAASGPAAAPPTPAPVTDGTALVSGANTAWNSAIERLEPRFDLPDEPSAKVLPPTPKAAAWDILREHARRGRAAGNHGDLYDNRDRGHSRLDPAAHPQVTHVRYSAAARAADVDYGLNDSLLFGRVTFGNSSTALTGGALWRSLPRFAMTRPDGTGPLRLWQNASANQIYVYPAHKDYGDDKDGGVGDLFPANTPYIIVTRGSSGSDQPFLDAVAMILAAFRPDTKARLTEANLVVPTVQMVFRRSLQNVLSRDDYFSAAAHPAAFERFNLNLARMVSLAQSIRPDDIPPQVLIRMVEEELGEEGVDYFGAGLGEQLFDTPAAIARIWRSRAFTRAMTVSAEATADPNGRPLSFEWRLLQGDPERVRITPEGDGRARIEIDWHEPFPISKDNPIRSARVDIGVFANNGVHDSAPAIFSIAFPTHETRTYAPGPDGVPRIASIDHADPARSAAYADPMLMARADWRDVYAYAADGTPSGWTRTRGALTEAFTPAGERILSRAPDGSPLSVEAMRYPLRRDAEGRLSVEETPAPRPDQAPIR
jgi:hypothetical protein